MEGSTPWDAVDASTARVAVVEKAVAVGLTVSVDAVVVGNKQADVAVAEDGWKPNQ